MKTITGAQKKSLQSALKEILMLGNLGTQEDICAALQERGYSVNQSRVSRWLRKVGAVKVKSVNDDLVYSLPSEPAPPSATAALSHLVIEITANEMAMVIRTSPGSASLIARMLDHHRHALGILGTVAGDDTIILIPASIKTMATLNHDVTEFLAALS